GLVCGDQPMVTPTAYGCNNRRSSFAAEQPTRRPEGLRGTTKEKQLYEEINTGDRRSLRCAGRNRCPGSRCRGTARLARKEKADYRPGSRGSALGVGERVGKHIGREMEAFDANYRA